jgi:hemerythrin-like domain-containing protein
VLRDKNLIPLSHQHQHALALCVRIDRASPVPEADLAAWQSEIAQQFNSEIALHFAAEEQVLFPAARKLKELAALVDELRVDHAELRELFAQAKAQTLPPGELSGFAQKLSTHIRKEERQLFELLQQLLSQEQLTQLGSKLELSLKDAEQACAMPNDTTRLRSRK